MKRAERRLLILLSIILVVFAAQIAFTMMTGPRRTSAVARIKKPASVIAYEQLMAELSGTSAPASEIGERSARSRQVLIEDARETIAGYKRLFAHIEEMAGGEDVPPYDDPSEWTKSDRAAVAEFLQLEHDLIEEIRRMAERGGPVAAFDLSDPTKTASNVAALRALRKCGELLQADATINAKQGNLDETVLDIVALVKLNDALAQEPWIALQMIRTVLCHDATDTIQRSTQSGDFSQGQVEQLVDQLGRAGRRDAFADAMTFETLTAHTTFTDGVHEIRGFSAMEIFSWLYTGPLGRPWSVKDEELIASTLSQVAEISYLPYYEAEPMLREMDAELSDIPFMRFFSRKMLPGSYAMSRRSIVGQAGTETSLDITRMGLLLEQYETQHGFYPETLDVIAPDLGGTVPVDPFTGQSYRYQPSSDSFLLYGVGQNLRDDSGRHHLGNGDIVWRGVTKIKE